MAIRPAYGLAALALFMTLPASANAAATTVHARFSLDALATCTQPAVQNFPLHVDGTGSLSVDRTATLDLSSNVLGVEHYDARLGGRPTEANGGSASVRVVSRHTLQAIRDYPNNSIVVYMTVIGHSCAIKVENRLKRGKREYTFYGSLGVAHCSKPRIVRAECTPL
jgi:hypothetical protein